MTLSPIALFAYKRPHHTQQCLESLAQNFGADQSELFIFCDAAKKPEDAEAVQQVRGLVKSKQWCGQVHITEQQENQGIAKTTTNAVTNLCEKYGSVIVVEDDLVLSPSFLNYMNTALERYKECEQVFQVSGYMFPIKFNAATDAVFLPFTTSWGWATWQRAWENFDPSMSGYSLLKKSKPLKKQFDLNDSYPYFKSLETQLTGKVNDWDIRWYLSTFLLNGLTLHPTQTLVHNLGFDGSGTNCGSLKERREGVLKSFKEDMFFPENLEIDSEMYNVVCQHLKELYNPSFLIRFFRKINRSSVGLFDLQ